MDFEIEDGRLLACLGNDEDLVIPEGVKFISRDCTFSNAAAIKSIYLPQSFLGFEKANKDDNYFIFNNETQTITNIYIKSDIDNYIPSHIAVLFESNTNSLDTYGLFDGLRLPNLERYSVHQGNPIYRDVDGLLYSEDLSCLLSVPSKNVDEVVLPRQLTTINPNIALAKHYAKLRVISLETFLRDKILEQLCLLPSQLVILYAPNLELYFSRSSNEKRQLKIDNLICCFPMLQEELMDNDKCASSAAMGYLFEPELYDQWHKRDCIKRLLLDEVYIYPLAAKNPSLKIVKDFYEQIWASSSMPKILPKKGFSSSVNLYEAILRGSLEDVQSALATNFDFHGLFEDVWVQNRYSGGQALALACRYGGVQKVRCLLENHNFCKAPKNKFLHSPLQEFIAGHNYLWVVSSLRFDIAINTHLYIADNAEIRGYTPLSEEERIECIELLFNQGIIREFTSPHAYVEPVDRMYIYALLSGESKIAKYLKGKGASLSTIFSASRYGQYAKDLKELLFQAIEIDPKSIVTLAKARQEEGSSLRVNLGMLLSILKTDESALSDLLSYIEIKAADRSDLLEIAIDRGNIKFLASALRHGLVKSKRSLDKFIEHASNKNAHEATAILLDYKDATLNSKKPAKAASKSKRPSLKL